MDFLKKHPLKIIALLLIGAIAGTLMFVPWTKTVEEKAKAYLVANGFPDADFKITHLGYSSATVEAISLGAAIPLEIGKLSAGYTAPKVKLTADNLHYKLPNIALNAGSAVVDADIVLDTPSGKGTWHIKDIETKAGELEIPLLNGAGSIAYDKNSLNVEGEFKNADQSHKANFTLTYPVNAPETAQLKLIAATFPWNKGKLSTKNVIIPLNGKSNIKMNLAVEHVPVDVLMQMLTGTPTPATGNVSGTIPITLKPDGNVVVGAGKLQTEAPGTIALAPETIPGDNEQIALVRDIMKNLHYKLLSVTMNSDKNGKLSIQMALEGNNPEVAEGRPVKLNVQLNGDVLNLIQQSLLSLIDPNMFLKQAPNAKQ